MALPMTANSSALYSLVRSGNAFNTSLIGTVGTTQSSMTSTANLINSLPSYANGLDVSGFVGMGSTLVGISTGALSSFTSHITSQFSSLTNNAGLYLGQLNLQQGLMGLGSTLESLKDEDYSTNICSSISNFFGSIIGDGEALINTVVGYIDQIETEINTIIGAGIALTQELINTVLGEVEGVISQVEAVANQIVSMITNEVAALASALSDMLNYAVSSVLSSLNQNPCGQLLLQAVGSPSLLSLL